MNTRSSLVLGIAIVVGCLIVTLFSNSASVGQGTAVAKERRYESVVGIVPAFGGGLPSSQIVVTDTFTGQTWVVRGVDNWVSVGKAPK